MAERLSRDFDYPEQYKREKVTRVMPDDLRKLGVYTLRMMWPPSERPPFATEFLTCITTVVQQTSGYFDISFVMQPKNEPIVSDALFNPSGFMIVSNSSEDLGLLNPPSEIEIAYFVGTQDPYDLELAELVAAATELASV